jgi:tetratricopeptide (TPR) repeat protein
LALAALLSGSCGSTRPEPTSDTNLVVITLDTTRADRLGCYGHAEAETPHLDGLASRGTRFVNAFAHSPLTLPSHCSVFTGLYPMGHGVRDNGGFKLNEEMDTLAEVLSDAGYVTAAFIGAKVLSNEFGIAQGFETYDASIPPGKVERSAGAVIDATVEWFEKHDGARFFVWVHLFDPHMPYEHPEPFKSRFADPYDGEMAYMDSQIGRLIELLEQRRMFDDSAIIVIGDHGESLGQHGEQDHGYYAYDSTLRVPLIVKPGGAAPVARVVEDLVRVVDVMPTALSLLGYGAPPSLDGIDMASLVRGETAATEVESYGESYIPYYRYGFSPIRSLRTRQYKLLLSPERELYDVEADPGETRNLAAELPAIADSLSASLAGYPDAPPPGLDATMAMDEETRAMLSALGYVGGTPEDPPESDTELPSALEGAQHHMDLTQIQLDFATKDLDDIQLDLDRVLAERPDSTAALELQAALYFQEREFAKAESTMVRIVEIQPNNAIALQKLAMAQMAQGKGQDALAVQLQVVSLVPHDREAREHLWKIYGGLGRISDALKDNEAVRQSDPSRGYPWLWLGFLQTSGGDATVAERAFTEATKDPETAYEAHVALGRLHRALRQNDKAEQAFQAAIAESYEPIEALVQLSRIRYEVGDKIGARDLLERARALAPEHPEVLGPLARINAELGED